MVILGRVDINPTFRTAPWAEPADESVDITIQIRADRDATRRLTGLAFRGTPITWAELVKALEEK